MSNGKNLTNWNEIKTDEAFRLSQAEFKGMTIQALQDLHDDIQEIKQERNIKGYIAYAISGFIGIIAGIMGGHLGK